MAKRFTATEKWNDGWFIGLSQSNKLIWLYILDTCTNAGRWVKNFKMLNFCCDTAITEAEFITVFKNRVVDCKDYFFIPKFLRYQYPKGLNSFKPAIVSVRNELKQYNLLSSVTKSLGNDYLMIKDTDKDKDKDTDNKELINNDNKVFNNDNNNKILYMEKVLLTKNEYAKLVDKFGEADARERISRLNEYGHQKPKKFREYGSHYHTILAWARKDETVTKKRMNTL